jgi:phytanoyl-CoA hydroxylase
MDILTDTQWETYQRDGFLILGTVLDASQLNALQQRIDDIMLGTADIDYSRTMMQLDGATGDYNDAGEHSNGHKGATLNYRKIQNLEQDPLYLEFMQRPLFRDICSRVYGANARIACFRAMFMNKPAGMGTKLPWHQDRWSNLDRDPEVTLWTALDPATTENGCVQVIPGSHLELINPDHEFGFLTPDQAAEHCSKNSVHLELQPGETVLLHNWLLHSSDKNNSKQSRRAFSACYMDASTCYTSGKPVDFPILFGESRESGEVI